MSTIGDYVILYDFNIEKDFDIDDGDLREVMKRLVDVKENDENTTIPRISRFTMWTDTKCFMENNFKIHDVGFLSDRKLIRALKSPRVLIYDDIASVFNKNIKTRNPFFLPIYFSHENILGGSLHCQAITLEDSPNQDEFLSMLDVCFSKITLPKKITDISPISYAHEITHSQVSSHRGSVENYYNTEVLSVYIELLFAYKRNEECFRYDLVNRLIHALSNYYTLFIYKYGDKSKLSANYDKVQFHIDAQYLQSILIALNLFVKTIYGTENTKKTINRQVQKVFDGKITVEQFLKSVGATYEESKDPIYVEKVLKKVK